MTRTVASRLPATEPLSDADLMTLRTDVGPAPLNIGAVLLLGRGARTHDVSRLLADRLGSVPRLRQVLVEPPHGRPVWSDDPDLDVTTHITSAVAAGAGREGPGLDVVLDLAAGILTTPLPRSWPPWRTVVLTAPGDDEVIAVVVMLHHVVADGLGGLLLLDRLTDDACDDRTDRTGGETGGHGASGTAPAGIRERSGARPEPPRARWVSRVRRGWHELGRPRAVTAPRTSLNRPTGPNRTLRVVSVPLAPLRTAAHCHRATLNDVLLVAVTGAMGGLLRRRGESASHLVVSVPVSGRRPGDTGLGNRSGVMPVRVPIDGDAERRLHAVAGTTRTLRSRVRGDSAALLVPAFRVLAAVGAFRWFVEHQRMVTTFLSNVPGPVRPVLLGGAPVLGLVPLTTTSGNIGVSFAALSYAGELTVTLTADPGVVPEVDVLAGLLATELTDLAALATLADLSDAAGTNGPVPRAHPAAGSIHGRLPE
ncbi:wax ester/triacylglycerol synthase family O-acyltransferase [Rothia sp. ARF10]|nr:wax ester/triacylglycerol synthase family O-acyltransferase [Rothia sp. ARF10]